MPREPAVYILANKPYGTLYVGVTNSLERRIYEHRHPSPEKVKKSFTQRYDCCQLVYFERYGTMPDAITREKQLKAGSRKKKLALIEAHNPDWYDLYPTL